MVDYPVFFEKMSGTGNDFVAIDNRNKLFTLQEMPEFVKQVCRRKFSVGADGIFFIENSENADFRWQFFNSDGSRAEMCGNGARCAASFAYRHGIASAKMCFETDAGIIKAEVQADGSVRIEMTSPLDYRTDMKVNLDGSDYLVNFVNTGVPHAVIFLDSVDVPVKKWGRKVRFHEHFQPAGTNANFVEVRRENEIKVRTYERGVEEETFACGTGAVASAIYAALLKDMASPIKVETSGGDILTIHFEVSEDRSSADKVFMEGSAHLIYSGQLTSEALL